MGFSVSGAAAIIFASMFIAFGVWYTAADNSFHQITDAQDAKTDGTLDMANTAIEISVAEYDETAGVLTVEVNNTGATERSLSATDLLVDGEFVRGWEVDAQVQHNSETDLWLPGETLTIELEYDETARVKLVTSAGVTATADVEVVA